MKLFWIFFFSLFNLFQNYNLPYLRECYLKAPNNNRITKELIAITESNKNEIIVKGYYGAAKIIMAKHYINPVSKWKTFNDGKAILESAIEKDKLNPELKFLRLSIQENLPSFLGYRNNIEQDRLFLKKSLPTITDNELKKIITSYLNNKK